ncbi:hypothetical protein BDR26DRAFT_914000 [Obelidium mucronatum]|nr:hypothetical protein BDR26DRAFT_914000 [Obelidium mucronatum]
MHQCQSVAQVTKLKATKHNKLYQTLISLLNEPGFLEKLKLAKSTPHQKESKTLLKKLADLVEKGGGSSGSTEICCFENLFIGLLPWIPLDVSYNFYRGFSTGDSDNPLIFHLSSPELPEGIPLPMPPLPKRIKIAAAHPGTYAKVYKLQMETIMEVLIGLKLSYLTKQSIPVGKQPNGLGGYPLNFAFVSEVTGSDQ